MAAPRAASPWISLLSSHVLQITTALRRQEISAAINSAAIFGSTLSGTHTRINLHLFKSE
jgi:hypothetical protein